MVQANRISKPVLWAYLILVIRIWLAYILCDYGYSKLTDGQFGLQPEELETKVSEIDLFRLSWYCSATSRLSHLLVGPRS